MYGVFRGETRVSPLPFLFHPLNDNDDDYETPDGRNIVQALSVQTA